MRSWRDNLDGRTELNVMAVGCSRGAAQVGGTGGFFGGSDRDVVGRWGWFHVPLMTHPTFCWNIEGKHKRIGWGMRRRVRKSDTVRCVGGNEGKERKKPIGEDAPILATVIHDPIAVQRVSKFLL